MGVAEVMGWKGVGWRVSGLIRLWKCVENPKKPSPRGAASGMCQRAQNEFCAT